MKIWRKKLNGWSLREQQESRMAMEYKFMMSSSLNSRVSMVSHVLFSQSFANLAFLRFGSRSREFPESRFLLLVSRFLWRLKFSQRPLSSIIKFPAITRSQQLGSETLICSFRDQNMLRDPQESAKETLRRNFNGITTTFVLVLHLCQNTLITTLDRFLQ